MSATTAGAEGLDLRRRLGDVSWPEIAAPAALIALVVAFGVADPGFVSAGNVAAMLQAAAILVVLTLGQTFVIASAGIDLSVASTMTLGAIIIGELHAAGQPIGVACLGGVAASTSVGLINGFLVAKGRITDFIVTLGMLSAALSLALILADGKPTQVIDSFLLQLTVGGLGIFSWAVLLALGLAVVGHLVLFHTAYGVHLLAVGGSKTSARATGVWAGFTTGLADVALPVVAHGLEPASWRSSRPTRRSTTSMRGTHRIPGHPSLGTVGHLRRGPPGGGAWPLHRDHARLLTT